jgi:type IV secretion system protein VirD4
VLLLLDEFARLGHADTLAKAFSFVAGYGLRLLPVLQSPAQLRGIYGADMAEEIIGNCGCEIVFAPKALKLSQELSERLGAFSFQATAQSRPSLFGRGGRSLTVSEQRRPLLLPQELTLLPPDQLIVLRAGLPPVRGRKIVYWRERAFSNRVQPPPVVPPRSLAPTPTSMAEPPRRTQPRASDKLSLETILPKLEAEGFPPPAEGADAAEIEAWVTRFLDGSARTPPEEPSHGR